METWYGILFDEISVKKNNLLFITILVSNYVIVESSLSTLLGTQLHTRKLFNILQNCKIHAKLSARYWMAFIIISRTMEKLITIVAYKLTCANLNSYANLLIFQAVSVLRDMAL